MVKLTEVEDEHFAEKPSSSKDNALFEDDDEYTDTGTHALRKEARNRNKTDAPQTRPFFILPFPTPLQDIFNTNNRSQKRPPTNTTKTFLLDSEISEASDLGDDPSLTVDETITERIL